MKTYFPEIKEYASILLSYSHIVEELRPIVGNNLIY